MKKLLLAIALLLWVAPMWAQSDSTITSGIAQDDTSSFEEVTYHAPNRNPIYYFGSPFAKHFAELDFMLGGNDLGIGLTYTYLPEVWGGHVSGLTSFTARWLLVGADYRLSKPWTKNDWHLFTSLGYRHGTNNRSLLASASKDEIVYGPAMELGVRVGRLPDWGSFCMTSASLGVLTDFHHVYITLGFSASVAILASSFLFLGL